MRTNVPQLNVAKAYILLIVFSSFFANNLQAQVEQYNIAGSAVVSGTTGCFRLTNTTSQSGAVWNKNTINLTDPIDITLSINLGGNPTTEYPNHNCGGDGMSFILQPIGAGVAGVGAGAGYSGITPSFGVVMDTYPNTDIGDPPVIDHISIHKNGNVNHGGFSGGDELTSHTIGTANGFPANVTDGNFHTFRFKWEPAAGGGTASVFFDDVFTTSYTGDIVNNIFGGNPNVYWGMSASTGGCWNVQSVCMSVVANFSSTGAFCIGSTINFNDLSFSGTPINSWSWDFGDGSTSTLQTPTHIFTANGEYTVRLTITNTSGQTSTMTHVVEIINPVVSIASVNSVCNGETITLHGTITATSTPTSYPSFSNNTGYAIPDEGVQGGWSGAGGSFAKSDIVVSGIAPEWKIGSICLNITHTWVSDLNIYLKDPCGNRILLSRSIGGSGDNYTNTCFSPAAVTSINGISAPFTGTWVPVGGNTSWAQTHSCTNPNGTWSLLVGDDSNGDVGSLLNWSISFINYSVGTYLWDPLNISDNLNPQFEATTSGWHFLTLSNTAGCSAKDSIYIDVSQAVNITTKDDTICVGETVTISAIGEPTYSWIWSNGATTNSTDVSPITTTTYSVTAQNGSCKKTAQVKVTVSQINVNLTGTTICKGNSATLSPIGAETYIWNTGATGAVYNISPTTTTTYTVTGTNTDGCEKTATATIIVDSLPIIKITPNDTTICLGEPINIVSNGYPTSTWKWSNGATTSTINVNPTTSTQYIVTVTNGICKDSAKVNINVSSVKVELSGTTICDGESATLTPTGADSYVWNTGSTDSPYTVSPNTTTTYTVTGSNSNNCKNVVSVDVNVKPLPTITLKAPSVCENEIATITANGATSYLWSNGSTQNPQIINSPQSSMYSVTGTLNGCVSSKSILLVVNPLPTVSFSVSELLGCTPLKIDFNSITTGSIAKWVWNMEGQNLSNAANFSYTFLNAGEYPVSLTVTSDSGCTSKSETKTIEVSHLIAEIYSNGSFVEGENVQFSDIGSGSTTWQWDFGNGTNSTSMQNNVVYDEAGEYLVKLLSQNKYGCISTDTLLVKINSIFTYYIPNAFSPNGDDINDVWLPRGLNWVEEGYDLRIFNRWGNIIFHTNDIYQPWTGLEKDVKQGVYTYIIKVTDIFGFERQYMGGITVFK